MKKHSVESKAEAHKASKAHKKMACHHKIPCVIGIALVVLLIVSLFTGGFGIKIGAVSKAKAAQKAVDYINTNLLEQGMEATILDVSVSGDLYNVKIDIAGREYDTYVTKDGSLFFPSAIDIKKPVITGNTVSTPDVVKSDKPDVKLFVMSYCPYGLQAMKALIPAYELLKDKADITINFVGYAMHGKQEVDENLRMYCIQKEQKDVFWKYLRCFVQTDDYKSCLDEAKVNKAKLESCISATDKEFGVTKSYEDQSTWLSGRFPVFAVEKNLDEQYSVQGSPTVIINGQEASIDRSAEGFKKAICAAFNKAPAECDTALSSAAAAPGIGSLDDTSASGSTASCG